MLLAEVRNRKFPLGHQVAELNFSGDSVMNLLKVFFFLKRLNLAKFGRSLYDDLSFQLR